MTDTDDTVTHPDSGREMTAPEDREAGDYYNPIDNLPTYRPPDYDIPIPYYPGPETADYDTFRDGEHDIEVYTRWMLAIEPEAIRRHATHWQRVHSMLSDAAGMLKLRRAKLAEAWGGEAAQVFLEHVDNTQRSTLDWQGGAANNAALLDGAAGDVEDARKYMFIFANHYYDMLSEWQNRETDKMLVNNPSAPGWTVDEPQLAAGDDQFRTPLPASTGMVPPQIGGNTTLIAGGKAAGESQIKELYHQHAANVVNVLASQYVDNHYYVDQPPRFRGPTELTPDQGAVTGGPPPASYLPPPVSGGVTPPPTYPPPGFGGFNPDVGAPPPGDGGDIAGGPPIGTLPPPVVTPPVGPPPSITPPGILPPPVMPPGVLPPGGNLPPGGIRPPAPPPPGGLRPPGPPAPPLRPGPAPIGQLRPPPPPAPPAGGRPAPALSGVRPPAGLRPGAVPPGAMPPGGRPGAAPPGGVRPGALPPGARPGTPPAGARPAPLPPGIRPGAPPTSARPGALPPGTRPGAAPAAGQRSGPAPLGAARPGPASLGAARPGVTRPGFTGPAGVRPTQGAPTLPGATAPRLARPNLRAAVVAAAGRAGQAPGPVQPPPATSVGRTAAAGMQARLSRPSQPTVTAQRGGPTLAGAARTGQPAGRGPAGRGQVGGTDQERRRLAAASSDEADEPDRDPWAVPKPTGLIQSTGPERPAAHGKPIEPAS